MKIKALREFKYEKIINRFESNPKPVPNPKPLPSKYIKQGHKLDLFM